MTTPETTTTAQPKVGWVNVLDHITKDRALPDGYDQWAFRTVRPDLSSSRGFKYPFPGHVAKAAGPFTVSNDECPPREGDGICAATTYQGMASCSVAARTLLLVAYKNEDVLGGSREIGKLRLREFLVVDLIDGEMLLRDLRGAYLRGADLRGAYLRGADLRGAYLRGADLQGAYLRGADLQGADLQGADLQGADLQGADLQDARNLTLPAGWKLNDFGLAVRT